MAAETPKPATLVAAPIAPRASIAPALAAPRTSIAPLAGPTTSILSQIFDLNYFTLFSLAKF
jgi:hypothetical protein